MSVHVTSPVWKHSKAKANRLLVLLAIADQANDHGWCWLSYPSIQQRCGFKDLDTVRNHIAGLEEMGELEVYERLGRTYAFRVIVEGVEVVPLSLDDMLPRGLTTTATPRGKTPGVGGPEKPQGTPGEKPVPPQGKNRPDPLGKTPDDTLDPSTDTLSTRPKRRDLIFEAICEAWGRTPDGLTRDERGRVNNAAKQLREVGASAAEIRVRVKRYHEEWPEMEISPQALTKHWGRFAEASKPKSGAVNMPGERPAPGDCPLIAEHGVSQVCRVCLYERKDTT